MLRVFSRVSRSARPLTACLATAALAGSLTGFGVGGHEVKLSVDGATRVVTVSAATVGDALREVGVDVSSHDGIVPGVDHAITDGMTVSITRAQPAWVMTEGTGAAQRMLVEGTSLHEQLLQVREEHPQAQIAVSRTPDSATILPLVAEDEPVSVVVDGETRQVEACGGATAAAVLAKTGIDVGPLDVAAAGLDGEGHPVVTITRMARAGISEDEEIPFETKEEADDSLFEGQRIVATPGVAGVKRITYAVTKTNGEEASKQPVKEEVVTEPVTEIVRVGTRKLPQGMTSAPAGTSSGDAQRIALGIMPEFGFGADQYECLLTLWTKESGWSSSATNPSSGAYGIPQALPGSKMASAGADWRTNPATQIRWGLGYIKGRYGTPCGALADWNRKGWY